MRLRKCRPRTNRNVCDGHFEWTEGWLRPLFYFIEIVSDVPLHDVSRRHSNPGFSDRDELSIKTERLWDHDLFRKRPRPIERDRLIESDPRHSRTQQ